MLKTITRASKAALLLTLLALLEGIEQSLARTDAGALEVAAVPALRAQLTARRARVARMLGDSAQALVLAQQALAELPSDDDWRAEVIHDVNEPPPMVRLPSVILGAVLLAPISFVAATHCASVLSLSAIWLTPFRGVE